MCTGFLLFPEEDSNGKACPDRFPEDNDFQKLPVKKVPGNLLVNIFLPYQQETQKFCIEVSDDSDKKQWECLVSDESPMDGALKFKMAFRIAEAEGK